MISFASGLLLGAVSGVSGDGALAQFDFRQRPAAALGFPRQT